MFRKVRKDGSSVICRLWVIEGVSGSERFAQSDWCGCGRNLEGECVGIIIDFGFGLRETGEQNGKKNRARARGLGEREFGAGLILSGPEGSSGACGSSSAGVHCIFS